MMHATVPTTTRETGPVALRSALLAGITGIAHGTTHRVGNPGTAHGNVAYGARRDNSEAWRMRQQWARQVGVDADSIVTLRQVHGTTIHRVTAGDAGRGARPGSTRIGEGDGLITDSPGVALMVLHADCQPILLVDPGRPAVAAAHAGWRGTVTNIAGEAVRAMHNAFGSRPDQLLAWLGAGISGCCNEVGPEVTAAWRQTAGSAGIDPDIAITRPGTREHFDVPVANRSLLLAAGLLPEHIDTAAECTRCDLDRWFSYRGHGPGTGHQGTLITIRPTAQDTHARH